MINSEAKAIYGKFNRFRSLIAGILVIAIGIVFAFLYTKFQKPTDGYLTTTGTITEISYNSSTEDYKVKVQFEVDGVTYSGIYDMYSSSYKVGTTVKVVYNILDPNDFHSDSSLFKYIPYGIIGLGIIFVLFPFLRKKANLNKANYVQEVPREKTLEDYINEDSNVSYAGNITTEPLGDGDMYKYNFKTLSNKEMILYDMNEMKVCSITTDNYKAIGKTSYKFTNFESGRSYEALVGPVVETSFNGYKEKSTFKFDGVDVWEYLDMKGIDVNIGISNLFPTYTIKKGSQVIGKAEYSALTSKIALPNARSLDLEGKAEYLDVLLIVCFAITRTNLV